MVADELKSRLRRCRTRGELKALAEQSLGETIACERRRLFFFDEMEQNSEFRESFESNPVSAAFLGRETALHEAQVVDNATWRRCCPRADHGHVLMGPLLVNLKLVGILAVTRSDCSHEFGGGDLANMNRLCLYFSNRLGQIEKPHPQNFDQLTPREKEVATLVRAGLMNGEVAEELVLSEHTVKQYLKSIYRKLGVRSRTELSNLL